MRFTALGGALEIGASCYLVEIDGKNILLDCGIRILHGDRVVQSGLPDLNQLNRLKSLDAVCISHAHMDHVGALPMVMERFRETFCFMTIATLPLAITMLRDQIQLLEQDSSHPSAQALNWFNESAMERLVSRIITAKFGQTFHPCPGKSLAITFLCAGHILGAAGVLIQGEEGSIFYSGDFTSTVQRTVRPADFSQAQGADALITETTYGGKQHRERGLEEMDFAAITARALTQGGNVLIPTFALGRAQEVILLLKEIIAKKKIPSSSIYADGMVREICDHYQELVQPDLFWGTNNTLSPVTRVNDPETRQYLLSGVSNIVVASSGQLIGGPSVSYARELLPSRQGALILTSYQDDEWLGQKLLRLKRGGVINLEGKDVHVQANIFRVPLSAHADSDQLVEMALHLNPKAVVGVHGEVKASDKFVENLRQMAYPGAVYLPRVGQTLKLPK